MPFLSKVSTFQFNKETCLSYGSFMMVKNLLLLINFLTLLGGLILIGGGGYINSTGGADGFLGAIAGTIGTAAIVIGVFVTFLSFMGCFGAANEKGILLKAYFSLLAIVVVLQIAVGAVAYAKRDEVGLLLEGAWIGSVSGPDPSGQATIQAVEKLFQCCGFRNTTDYAIPAGANCTLLNPTYTQSCQSSIISSIQASLNTIGGAGLAMGVIEFIGLIFSALLFTKIAQREKASESLLNEAWRINRSKIQYGYQSYSYV